MIGRKFQKNDQSKRDVEFEFFGKHKLIRELSLYTFWDDIDCDIIDLFYNNNLITFDIYLIHFKNKQNIYSLNWKKLILFVFDCIHYWTQSFSICCDIHFRLISFRIKQSKTWSIISIENIRQTDFHIQHEIFKAIDQKWISLLIIQNQISLLRTFKTQQVIFFFYIDQNGDVTYKSKTFWILDHKFTIWKRRWSDSCWRKCWKRHE